MQKGTNKAGKYPSLGSLPSLLSNHKATRKPDQPHPLPHVYHNETATVTTKRGCKRTTKTLDILPCSSSHILSCKPPLFRIDWAFHSFLSTKKTRLSIKTSTNRAIFSFITHSHSKSFCFSLARSTGQWLYGLLSPVLRSLLLQLPPCFVFM